MRYFSTGKNCPNVSFKEAVLSGLAPDGGLYMPESIPELPKAFFDEIKKLSLQQIAMKLAGPFVEGELSSSELKTIVQSAVNFDAPLVSLNSDIHILELFHGPTLAFKDFGARFMARVLEHFATTADSEFVVLAATSGDTGSAVASGCFGIPGVRVVLLYPSGKVSQIQEQQLTTLGGNVVTLEVRGSFDDCQCLVKEAFTDSEIRNSMTLTSANSINVARLIPQMFYYVYAYAQLEDKERPVVFSVPSGNFGNLTAGCFARKMGLPVSQFIASTNANSIVPRYLETGEFLPKPSIATISNAMDVGNPSNFARLNSLYGSSVEKMRSEIVGASFSEERTKDAMREVSREFSYVMDPHGAVGYLGLRDYQKTHTDAQGIVFETAHPAKFLEVVEEATGKAVEVPGRLAECLKKEKQAELIAAVYGDFKDFLLGL